MKSLWRGAFKYPAGAVIEYAYAHSREQARVIMCLRMAKRDGVHPAAVLGTFDKGDNYSVEIEMEVRESDKD